MDSFLMYGVLIDTQFNYTHAAQLYAERYPLQRHPSRRTFARFAQRIAATGRFDFGKRNRTRPATGEEHSELVLEAIRGNPHHSTRNLSQELGISHMSVHRILSRAHLFPYRMSRHQVLLDRDHESRLRFCRWAQDQTLALPDFFSRVLFSDEATFSKCGRVNTHNVRYWAEENPRWLRQVDNQYNWSLNVWCGVVGDIVIGPHFFDTILTGPIYEHFLRNILPILLDDVPLGIRLTMRFQQDGAPPHSTLANKAFLNLMFPGKWIGRGGPIAWPPRSPDLTPLDYFLWGRIKDVVYRTAPTTRADMRQRIVDACNSITVEELRNVQNSFVRRIQKCIDVEGGHFEHWHR